MKYTTGIITDKDIWNNFVIDNFSFYSFLCSWQWGEFQQLEGNEVTRMGIYKESELIGIFMLVFVEAKRAKYFFTPHGPLIKDDYFEVLESILGDIEKIAQEKGASFLRINTVSENRIVNQKSYKKLGFLSSPMHVHAENTHLLDLSKTEDELMKNLRKGTRYIINRGKKEGVSITISDEKSDIDLLIKMHNLHAKRSNGKNTYSAFTERYIRNLFKVFDDKSITLMKAEYKGETEAILMTIKFGKSCVYYISASDIKHPKFSPAYLLQWEAIMKAKNDGCLTYNFWGVSPDNNKKHPIQGVTLFKRGFGGYDYDLLHARDYVFNGLRYSFNYLIETSRRIKRGYYYKKAA